MLFGSSGIRRQYDADLVRLALRVGAAVAKRSKKVIVGRDTRTTGQVMADSFISGVLAAGGDIFDGGIAPTPTVAFYTRNGDAGCSITASHNPEPYNGLKLFNPDGGSFTLEQQGEIEDLLAQQHWTAWTEQGCRRSADLVDSHIRQIVRHVDIPGNISMLIDCGNGAGSVITPPMLSGAGMNNICLNCNVSGRFSRPSEPLESSVPYVGGLVRSQGTRGAIIHDGDADRMMAFDERGRYIKGDHLLILFAKYLDARRVVTTVDASMAVEEIADVQRTPVGDSFVSERLIRWGDFGGEPSGSWIFPGHSLCPDGIYAAALFCEISSEWNVADVVDDMPDYPIIRESIRFEDPAAVLRSIGASKPTDGVRIDEEDGWCLIRASGTEPKVRITAEGRTARTAREMADKGRRLIENANTD